VKEISFEEKKKFLEGKLTEEEIGEVMRRFNEGSSDAKLVVPTKVTADPLYSNV
jgi:hypothetical protein